MMGTWVSPEGSRSWNVEEPGSDIWCRACRQGLGWDLLEGKEKRTEALETQIPETPADVDGETVSEPGDPGILISVG